MHLSNLINSQIKENLAYSKQAPGKQVPPQVQKNEQAASAKKSVSAEKLLDSKRAALQTHHERVAAEEKEISNPRYIYINNYKGSATPLLIKVLDEDEKKEQSGKKSFEQVEMEFHLETENLGPVLLRLKIVGGLYYCTIYLYSEEIKEYLGDNGAEMDLVWEDLFEKAGLEKHRFHKIEWKLFSAEDMQRHMSEKSRFLLDQRV